LEQAGREFDEPGYGEEDANTPEEEVGTSKSSSG